MPTPSRTRRAAVTFAVLGLLATVAVTNPHALAEQNGADTDECGVSEILVNECRPWLGARAWDYPASGESVRAQFEHHEERVGRRMDIAHTFAAEGKLPLSTAGERELARRADTYVYQNWKPAERWADAAGGDAKVDEHIDAAADRIAEVAPKKIFLTVHHEPENDVDSDSKCDTNSDAAAGSARDYRDMWHNVRERFDAKGVDNVVWVMDYMNYEKWDCLVPKLYPGDEYVDWVMFNAYGTGASDDFADNVRHFYDLLTKLSSSETDFVSKPWGIVEWGISGSDQRQARDYYDQAAASLDRKLFPKLASYMIFDSPGTHADGGLRVGYDDDGEVDPAEQEHYTDFANHPAFDG